MRLKLWAQFRVVTLIPPRFFGLEMGVMGGVCGLTGAIGL